MCSVIIGVVLFYADRHKNYPIDFRLMVKRKLRKLTKIDQAIILVRNAKLGLGLSVRYIAFDAWYFTIKLVKELRELELIWITRTKGDRKFLVNGVKMKAKEIINHCLKSGIKNLTAILPKYGKVKLVMKEMNNDWYLLVTNGLELKPKRIMRMSDMR
jgi:hypothetical protein